MTTTYRAQSDGRSERSNKTVVQILRQHTIKQQSRWLQSLPAAEHAINSSLNVAIGTSPFELVFGRKPSLFPLGIQPSDDSLPASWIEKHEDEWAAMRDKLWESRVQQAFQYNKKRWPHTPIQTGDWVMIKASSRHRTQGGIAKLKEHFEGPYLVTEVLNDGRNFRLQLNDNDRSNKNFHISKLKIYHSSEGVSRMVPVMRRREDILQK